MNNYDIEKSELRQRESKRKIFGQQFRSKMQQKSTIDNNCVCKKSNSIEEDINSGLNDLLKKQVDQLLNSNKELKQLLYEERSKYDSLFQEYEQLIQKNNLMERQYINLKYEHSKEIKNIKKSYFQKISNFLQKQIQIFTHSIQEQVLWQGIKHKIQMFILQLRNCCAVVEDSKIKKPNRESKQAYLQKIKCSNKSENQDHIDFKTQKNQTSEVAQITSEFKIAASPSKQTQQNKQHKQVANDIQKAIIFEDEYYGNLQDYGQYQQKILQRKNYELLKNCNRISDNRRKKIFDMSEPSQLG